MIPYNQAKVDSWKTFITVCPEYAQWARGQIEPHVHRDESADELISWLDSHAALMYNPAYMQQYM